MTPRLSILVSGLLPRLHMSRELAFDLEMQSTVTKGEAETIWMLDCGHLPTGIKRNALLDVARGEYIAFVDDDDMIAPDYVKRILSAVPEGPDVISFGIDYSMDDKHVFEARFDLRQPWHSDGGKVVRTYTGSHTMAWKRALVKDLRFAALYYGEDVPFTRAACSLASTQVMLPDVLYFYRCRSGVKEHTINQALDTI